jgi:hypothetical protein
MLLGCLSKPTTKPTERTTRKKYHYRSAERNVAAKPNTGWIAAKEAESDMSISLGTNAVVEHLTKVILKRADYPKGC